MKKGDTGTGIMRAGGFPDRGFVLTEDGKIDFKHAVPGQTVEYRIAKKRNGHYEGTVLSVLKKSDIETNPFPCIHAGECGGCLYQTVGYAEQLSLKESQLKELLSAASDGPLPWEGMAGSPVLEGYRVKMEFSFGDEKMGGDLALGMHKRGGHYDIVNADGCRLSHPDVSLLLAATRDYFSENGIPFFHKKSCEGYLRHFVVRYGFKTGEILADLVTTDFTGTEAEEKALLDGWKERLLAIRTDGRLVGILHTRNNSPSDAVIDQGTEILYGRDYFYEELSGLSFRISVFSFFQNNSGGAELLYEKVRAYLGDTRDLTVFDLYCGTGTIAQLTAARAKKAVGVEIIPEAVEAARENAKRNGIQNCEFIAGDVLKVLDSLTEKPDVIILDPPRDGINPRALPKMIRYGVNKIIYVSCKPSSFVRDMEVLKAGGYRIKRACGVDLFPFTPNAEAVLLLEKSSCPEEKNSQGTDTEEEKGCSNDPEGKTNKVTV